LKGIIGKKLGRRPPKNAPAIMFASFRNAGIVVPTPPPSLDHFSDVTKWILGGNDQFGTCGPTSIANLYLLVTSLLGAGVTVTEDDVFDLYRRSGNPNFDPTTDTDDNGVDIQTMLEALLSGGIAGHKPVAFVKFDPTNLAQLWDGIHLFGGVIFGVNLEVAQQTQGTTWDYKKSKAWGGHAICVGKYVSEPDLTSCISWAEIVGMTDRFLETPGFQVEEAWGVLWKETLDKLTADEYTDFVAEYKAVTGKDFPLPAPTPTPTPVPPTPTPTPTNNTDDQTLAATVKPWANLVHYGQNKIAAKAIKVWLKAKNL